MKVTLILHRVFEKGFLKFKIPEDQNTYLLGEVLMNCKAKHGDNVKVTVETPCRIRTLTQNAKLHALLTELCNETGDELEYLKYVLKVRAIRRGYPQKTDSKGEPLFNKRTGEPLPKSSKECTTQELEPLFEEIYQVAAELGVYLE